MAEERTSLVGDDLQTQLTEHESGLSEEVRRLKEQLAHVYQAWMSGHPPPPPLQGLSEGVPTIPISTQAPHSGITDPLYPPGFSPTYNFPTNPGTSTIRPPVAPPRSTPLVVPTASIFTIPQPPPIPRPVNETQPTAFDNHYYSPEMTFRAPGPYNLHPQYDLPVENEKFNMIGEQDEISRKVKSLEQALRNMQGVGGTMNVSYKDLCLFPDIQLPTGFKAPKFELYNGQGDPVAHLRSYCTKMRGAGGKNELLMAYFSQSLSGSASEWYTRQDPSKWYTWDDMAQAFVRQFQYNIDIVPDRVSLTKMIKKTDESFREYGIRWREQAARVSPPMVESEMVDYFLQAQDSTYFSNLISAMGRSFNDVVKMGEMVEEGIKSGKVISHSALKATTQAIQSGFGNFGIKKKREDVAMVTQGPRQGPRGNPRHYNPHYYPVHDSQYPVYTTQPYVRSPRYQNPRPYSQNVRAPYNPHLRQEHDWNPRPRDHFTPIGESYESVFKKLRSLNAIGTIPQNHADPNSKGFNPTARCEYHSNAQGHSTEDCRSLKKEVERMIQAKMIVVQDSDPPNITQNPLPANNDVHFIEMICCDKECSNSPHSQEKATEISGGSIKTDVQTSG